MRRMCSVEKSKKPGRMPALLWMIIRALRSGEVHGLTEPLLAEMWGAAIDVGMVEDRDARIEGGTDQPLDVRVAHLGNTHQAEHDARDCEVRMGDGVGLQGVIKPCE